MSDSKFFGWLGFMLGEDLPKCTVCHREACYQVVVAVQSHPIRVVPYCGSRRCYRAIKNFLRSKEYILRVEKI